MIRNVDNSSDLRPFYIYSDELLLKQFCLSISPRLAMIESQVYCLLPPTCAVSPLLTASIQNCSALATTSFNHSLLMYCAALADRTTEWSTGHRQNVWTSTRPVIAITRTLDIGVHQIRSSVGLHPGIPQRYIFARFRKFLEL